MVAEQFANPAHRQEVERAQSSQNDPPLARRLAVSVLRLRQWSGSVRASSESEPPAVAFEWASDRPRYAGTALHGFLQRIAREGLEAWDDAAVRSHRGAYRAVLANLGTPPGDLQWAVERVESGLLQTLRDPRGRWLLDDHAEAASELPIAGLIGGNLCEAVIDRTFIDENGVRWIIDYKTSAHEGAGLENFLEKEKERYREQLERYARLMFQRDRPAHPAGPVFPAAGRMAGMARAGAFAQAGIAVRALGTASLRRYVKMQLPTYFHTRGRSSAG